jgi:DnaJ-class molecular chaperone
MDSPAPGDEYYDRLGMMSSATDADLRRAWRSLAARYHPARAGLSATA